MSMVQEMIRPTMPCPDPSSKKRKADEECVGEMVVKASKSWNIRLGRRASGIRNPIREIMDTITGKENPSKNILSLAQGDPTAYPHLRPCPEMLAAVAGAFSAGLDHGYQPSQGNAKARKALAEYFNVPNRLPLTEKDVYMTIGCSEGLSHIVAALAADGSNMLVPKPGFPLYQVLCDYHGVEVRYYDLLPDRDWEIDLDSCKRLADANTCAILVNSPSNPCGAVYSKKHLEEVMSFCEEAKLPVIADEVYSKMSFGDVFVPCASVNPNVPVISVCALSKRWLAPGWRLGWIMVHDTQDRVLAKADLPGTLLQLCQVSLGPTAPLQAAVPALLRNTPQEWYTEVVRHLRTQAACCVRRCKAVPGLEVCSEPMGSMYFIAKIQPGVFGEPINNDDVAFAGALLAEESVVILPGQCFQYPGYFRVVFAAPVHILEEAWDRIEAFCKRKAKAVKLE